MKARKIHSAASGHANYLTRIPSRVPRHRIVVHNQVRTARRLGTRGFRAWLADPGDHYEVCKCGWAPELDAHYRVRRQGKKCEALSESYIERLIGAIPHDDPMRKKALRQLRHGKARTEMEKVLRKCMLAICELYALQRRYRRARGESFVRGGTICNSNKKDLPFLAAKGAGVEDLRETLAEFFASKSDATRAKVKKRRSISGP